MYVFFRRLQDFLYLLWLNLYVSWWDFREYLRVIWRYYGNRDFRKADLWMVWLYLLRSPYKISKRFLASRGEADIYAYGETPLTTLAEVSQACRLSKADRVYELGCGRGRTCFWLRAFVGCEVFGVEYIPIFIKVAQFIQDKVGIKGIHFEEGDMVDLDFSQATCVYLYGTGFDREVLESLVEAMLKLPDGARLVTVSYPITDYAPEGMFEITEIVDGRFNWGEAKLFIQVRKKA